jgi:Zn finger protein HypA/HybF involved in hydrogenase expression
MNTIQKVGKEKMSEIVKQSTSIAEVFREIGLSISSDAYQLFRKEMKNMNIDISHFVSKGIMKRNNIKEEFVINSNAPNAGIKNYILKNSLIEYKCNICNLEPKWNNKVLILQLDHINGINNDNRLSNLRFLCPNCHSQTHTFAGKNK